MATKQQVIQAALRLHKVSSRRNAELEDLRPSIENLRRVCKSYLKENKWKN
jgi:hypothetical protein